MPKSRSVYYLQSAKKPIKWGFLKILKNRYEIDRLFCSSNIPKPCAFFDPSPASYTKDKYMKADDVLKEQMIQEVFNIYRTKNIFPITYYNIKLFKII